MYHPVLFIFFFEKPKIKHETLRNEYDNNGGLKCVDIKILGEIMKILNAWGT